MLSRPKFLNDFQVSHHLFKDIEIIIFLFTFSYFQSFLAESLKMKKNKIELYALYFLLIDALRVLSEWNYVKL